MANEDMYELQKRWGSFAADKAKAKRAIQERDAADTAEIARLREQIIKRNKGFDEEWRTAKDDLQRRRDEAVMAELAIPGRSAQGILKDLGSNNTVWIYALRAQVMAIKPIPAPTNVNSQPQSNQRADRPQLLHKSGKRFLSPDELKFGQGERVRALEPYTVALAGDVGTVTSVPVSTTPIYYVTVDRSGETGIIPERLLESE